MYLCVIMDWYSKKVISWSLFNSLDVDFCVSSLERTIFNNGKPEIFDTDQGSQYTSREFIKALKRFSLKYGLIYIRDFDSVKELMSALRDWFKYQKVHHSL